VSDSSTFERLAAGPGRNLLEDLDDSKRFAPAKRERVAQAVLAHAEAVSLVSIPRARSILRCLSGRQAEDECREAACEWREDRNPGLEAPERGEVRL
jgi:ribonuclease HII